MNITYIRISMLYGATWNSNRMDDDMLEKLKESLVRYGLVNPLVVRLIADSQYEVLSGNQRLRVIREMGVPYVPCVIVELDDNQAMLMAQALNGIRGEDDLTLKSILLKKILSSIPEDNVLSILPETSDSLQALSSLSQSDLAEHLQAWEEAQAVKLKHMQLQFTRPQLDTVEEALSLILPKAKDAKSDNPNNRGNAMFLLCKFYLDRRQSE
jgi:ParB family transcriptional regulator, chromosome partitioning protein